MNRFFAFLILIIATVPTHADTPTWESCALDGADFFYSVKDIYTGMSAEESGRRFAPVVAEMFKNKSIVEAYMSGHARIYACGQKARDLSVPDEPVGYKACVGTSSVRFFILDQIRKNESEETIVKNAGERYRDVVERLYTESKESFFNATVLSSASHIACVARVTDE